MRELSLHGKALLELLMDGRSHTKYEIKQLIKHHKKSQKREDCRGGNYPSDQYMWYVISSIRSHIRPKGYDILCVYRSRRIHYQLVRLVGDPY